MLIIIVLNKIEHKVKKLDPTKFSWGTNKCVGFEITKI